MTKTQIDRLGERLKKGNVEESDIRLLDSYRRSFSESYEKVVKIIREQLGLQPTGRPAKSTPSIIEKLRRESIRLSQIQDIAGCRVIVDDVGMQSETIARLTGVFVDAVIFDRRERPSHGYRAVHVVLKCDEKLVEIQIRTRLQQLWAELSEKLSDAVDPAIKYGGGPESIRSRLSEISELTAQLGKMPKESQARASKLLQDIITQLPKGKNDALPD